MNIQAILVSDLHVEDLDLRPILAHSGFPFAQIGRRLPAIAGKLGEGFGGGQVEALGVFLHHAMGIKDRRDAADRFAHQLQPRERQPAIGPRIIEGNDLILEQLVKTGGIDIVLKLHVAVLDLGADHPSIFVVVTFAPPAIEDAEVEAAVGRQLHAAGAAGFERTKRSVQPKIDPLDKSTPDVGIVVFDEDDAIFEARFVAQFENLLNERFSAFIARMRFAGENELHRSRHVVDQAKEAIGVAEE